jgi:hypothetical protein
VKKIKRNKKEIKGVDRRAFITKGSMALASLGISPWISAEVLSDIARMIIPTAEAQTPGGRGKRRLIEICIRAGAPLSNMTPPPNWAPSIGGTIATDTNFHSDFSAITINTTSSGRPVLLSRPAAALAPHASDIAYTQALIQMDGHTGLWSDRSGGMVVDDNNIPSATAAAPAVFNAANSQLGAMLGGVHFATSNGVVNSVNMFSDLPRLSSSNNGLDGNDPFVRMFGPKPLRLTAAERDAVLLGISKLGDAQFGRLKARLNPVSVDEAKKAQMEAAALLQTNIQAAIQSDYNSIIGTFTPGNAMGTGYFLPKALALSAISFTRNLASTTMVTVDTGDWHGDNNTVRDDSARPARFSAYLAGCLAPLISYLKSNSDTINGGTLWDNTVISIGTEFGRAARLSVNADNPDGGMKYAAFMGGPIRGGHLGTVSGQDGAVTGFDSVSGATGGNRVHPAAVYKTVLVALGYSQSEVAAHMGGQAANGLTILAALKGPVS